MFLTLKLSVSNGQATSGNFGNIRTPGDYIGCTFGTNAASDIKNEDNMPIMFYTNAGSGGLANLRMLIEGTSGFVGVGNNFTVYTPSFFLDVENNINVNFSGATPITTFGIGYSIGGNTVFQIPGIRNTFAGVNS